MRGRWGGGGGEVKGKGKVHVVVKIWKKSPFFTYM